MECYLPIATKNMASEISIGIGMQHPSSTNRKKPNHLRDSVSFCDNISVINLPDGQNN